MSQPTSAAPSRKKTVISLLVLAALTGIIVLLFKDNWAEITAALSQLSAWQVLVVLAIGLSYPLLEGCVAWVIVRSRIPGFRLWQGIDTAWCGTFGNVVTLGAGAVPVQTWYLHRCGLPLGPGVGLMTLEYVFHKTTVLLYATVMLLLQHKWLAANTSGVLNYLPMAYAVVAAILVVLVLVCVSPLIQNLARWLMQFLPKTENGSSAGPTGSSSWTFWARRAAACWRINPAAQNFRPAGRQAVRAVLPAVPVHPVHGAFAAELCTGAAAHQPDAVPLERFAQRGRHGLHRNSLPAGVRQLSRARRGDERAHALPHRQLLRRVRRQCRGLLLRPAASG